LTHGSDCCSAFSVPVQVTREPQSSGQNEQPETHITTMAQEICLCDPGAQLTKRSRSLKCLYLWKCSSAQVPPKGTLKSVGQHRDYTNNGSKFGAALH
jgi:hypothetical protein